MILVWTFIFFIMIYHSIWNFWLFVFANYCISVSNVQCLYSCFSVLKHASGFFFPKCIIAFQIREGRKQTLAECLKKEFRLTMNILREVICGDVYEVISKFSSIIAPLLWLLQIVQIHERFLLDLKFMFSLVKWRVSELSILTKITLRKYALSLCLSLNLILWKFWHEVLLKCWLI